MRGGTLVVCAMTPGVTRGQATAAGRPPAATSGDAKSRTPAENQTVRNVFVIGPDKKVKLILVYPMTTGRNFTVGELDTGSEL